MSETAFPINDLLRRRLQTGLTIFSLTTCVAATLFLLLFSGQVGLGISSVAQNTLTRGISNVFSQFLLFVGGLIFVIGAVIVSFIVFLLMAQRTKDFGLMKATGCPNSLVFGYFFTELLGVTLVGCILGVIIGFIADYAVINLSVFQVYNKEPNLWFIPLVFVAFFAFALIFGAKPIFSASRMPPIKAISPVQYLGLGRGSQLKPLAKKGLTIRIATRSLFRRKSATLRIVIFLSAVFILLTVSIAGGIIANDTSASWVQNATGKNTILVANRSLANQYTQLLLTFSGTKENPNFNFSDPKFAISDSALQELKQVQGVSTVDARLIWNTSIQEVAGFTTDPNTLSTIPVGDSRQGNSIVIGVDVEKLVTVPLTTGHFLNDSSGLNAVVGDSIAQSLYTSITVTSGYQKETIIGDPLLESVKIQNTTFAITGICLDPLNNGNITYVPINRLENITGINSPNIILISIDSSANYASTLAQIQAKISGVNSDLVAISLNQAVKQNIDFLDSLWSVVMFLPAFALVAAAICLVNFVMLNIDEQHQEFAILRATGGKPRAIVSILATQSLIVLLSSLGIGILMGTIITIFILITNPIISISTIVTISAWLLAALASMFIISLYPAMKFVKKPLPEIMS